jgi:hypothetical protein
MELKKCTKCITPETAETITFDSEGVCSVCRQIEEKEKIDWDMLPSYVTSLLLKFHFWPNKPEGEEVVYVTNEFNPYK